MQHGNKTSTVLSTSVDTYTQTTADVNSTGFREVDNQGSGKIKVKASVHLSSLTADGAEPRLAGQSHVNAVAAGQTGKGTTFTPTVASGLSNLNEMKGASGKKSATTVGYYDRGEFEELSLSSGRREASARAEAARMEAQMHENEVKDKKVDAPEVVLGAQDEKRKTIPVRGFVEMTDEQREFVERFLVEKGYLNDMPEKW